MSWEKLGSTSVKCPCGKGLITRTDYGDDWNRVKSDLIIECSVCNSKYNLESEYHIKHPGDDWTSYYLIERSYPSYRGMYTRNASFDPINIYEVPFFEYLIKKYLSKDLATAIHELENVSAVSRLTGVAAKISKEHKSAFHSARITQLREDVKKAITDYDKYPDNKDYRFPIEEKEKQQRQEYENEKKKHMIFIPL